MKKIIYNNELLIKGYLDKNIDPDIDILAEILAMKKEKKAVILAHYYQSSDIQDIADVVGDSLYLSQQAEKSKADMIVFCGVHFMAETAKILCPEKRVLLPDLMAGCSLADSCKADDFKLFLSQYPNHKVVSYINTTAEIKALSDVICTSSNAVQIIESIPGNEEIVFAPDRNLGNYIESITGRKMVIWDGACHVHEQFSLERILELRKIYPDAKIIAHPECIKQILIIADFIGSTSALLRFTFGDDAKEYIVATESGIIHQMRKVNPNKVYLAAPPKDSTCGCNDCIYMKLNTVEKLYNCMKFEMPEILVAEDIRKKALGSIQTMLNISENLGL